MFLSHSLIATAVTSRRGARVSILGRESRSVIHAETKIKSCVRV